MDVQIKPGKYIIAVSGGVDSMVLLDIAHKIPGVHLVVAHYNHGIRHDSIEEQKLVGETAKRYGLPYIYEQGDLGPKTSEAVARDKRHAFLREVAAMHQANAVIMAHHQDDLVETILLNLMRGSGRKGLTSLRSNSQLLRPLLAYRKQAILDYATHNHIQWREDSTNADDTYKRNYVRHKITPKLSNWQRTELLRMHWQMCVTNDELDTGLAMLASQLKTRDGFDRQKFIMLPHAVAKECIATIMRHNNVQSIDRKLIERVVVAVKVAAVGSRYDIDKTTIMEISRKNVQFVPRDARNTRV